MKIYSIIMFAVSFLMISCGRGGAVGRWGDSVGRWEAKGWAKYEILGVPDKFFGVESHVKSETASAVVAVWREGWIIVRNMPKMNIRF